MFSSHPFEVRPQQAEGFTNLLSPVGSRAAKRLVPWTKSWLGPNSRTVKYVKVPERGDISPLGTKETESGRQSTRVSEAAQRIDSNNSDAHSKSQNRSIIFRNAHKADSLVSIRHRNNKSKIENYSTLVEEGDNTTRTLEATRHTRSKRVSDYWM